MDELRTPDTTVGEDVNLEAPAKEQEAWTDADIERLRGMIGGKAGLADGAIPAVLFVAANAIWSLNVGALAAAAYGMSALVYRKIRKQPIKHAAYGMVGLGISVGIALWTKNPNAYFVPGAAWGAVSGLMFLLTAVLGQPVSSMFAMALENKPREYYELPSVRRVHVRVTAIWGLIFLGRSLFRAFLIANDQTELLGASAVFLGYPLTAGMVGLSVVFLRRAAKRFEVPVVEVADSEIGPEIADPA